MRGDDGRDRRRVQVGPRRHGRPTEPAKPIPPPPALEGVGRLAGLVGPIGSVFSHDVHAIRASEMRAKFAGEVATFNALTGRKTDTGELIRIVAACSQHTRNEWAVCAGRMLHIMREHPHWEPAMWESALRWDYRVGAKLDASRVTEKP